jgi:DNA-directed RNA polymerase subunit RPC12/RpoP
MSKAEVLCPCCHKTLYTHELHDEGLIGPDAGIREDSDGHYLRCPHCAMRVAAERKDNLPRAGFKLSAHQQCDQKAG